MSFLYIIFISQLNNVQNFVLIQKGYSSMTDLMFGMRQRDSGITSYPIRNRQRVISYAITIALREYKPQ